MSLTMIDGQAFVKVGNFTYVCIGDEAEVSKATPNELASIIQRSLATSVYNNIKTSKGWVKT